MLPDVIHKKFKWLRHLRVLKHHTVKGGTFYCACSALPGEGWDIFNTKTLTQNISTSFNFLKNPKTLRDVSFEDDSNALVCFEK